MSVRPIFEHSGSFSPQDARELSIAFENCLKALKLVDRSHPAVLMLASRLIGLASDGQRNAEWLTEQALQLLKSEARPSLIGQRARPSDPMNSRKSCSRLRTDASDAAGCHWVDGDRRERQHRRPNRLESKPDVPAPLFALLPALD